jgi:methylthioribose-1-phosphate isomerase
MAIKIPETIAWKNGRLKLIDQTQLPGKLCYEYCDDVKAVWDAIKQLKVRGAPALGVTAGYGVLVALKNFKPASSRELIAKVDETVEYLGASRPTAVNLMWALKRMQAVAHAMQDSSIADIKKALKNEAVAIHEEDKRLCEKLGMYGARVIRSGSTVLTHCNAGALATGGMGTALAGIFVAHDKGKKVSVIADETRPLLQGARLTTWEMRQAGIDVTLICDNMTAQVMKEGKVDLVITGADRIAANGDAANKIGTYGVALLAKAHGIPFYVAAPSSTFDLSLKTGDEIPIEQRDPEEVTNGFGRRTAPGKINVYNPAFDVTPARLIAGLITEKGIISPPSTRAIASLLGGNSPKKKVVKKASGKSKRGKA